jgi:hypothetical protein
MFGLWFLTTVLLSMSSSFHSSNPVGENVMMYYVWLNYVVWPVLLLAGIYFCRLNGVVLYEKQTGSHLLKRVEEIAFKKEVYGVETE